RRAADQRAPGASGGVAKADARSAAQSGLSEQADRADGADEYDRAAALRWPRPGDAAGAAHARSTGRGRRAAGADGGLRRGSAWQGDGVKMLSIVAGTSFIETSRAGNHADR